MDQYAIKNDRSKINDTVFMWFWFRNKLNETFFLKNIQNYFHNKSNELSIIHGILSNSIRKVYFWLFGNTGKYTGIRSLYDSGLSRKFKIIWGSKRVIFIKIQSKHSIADNWGHLGSICPLDLISDVSSQWRLILSNWRPQNLTQEWPFLTLLPAGAPTARKMTSLLSKGYI